jgi:hypothetical protein
MKTGPIPMVRIKGLQGAAAGFGSINKCDGLGTNNQFDKVRTEG